MRNYNQDLQVKEGVVTPSPDTKEFFNQELGKCLYCGCSWCRKRVKELKNQEKEK